MTLTKRDSEILARLIARNGRDNVELATANIARPEHMTLTIVANGGLHPVPSDYVFGRLYYASMGNLDFSDITSVQLEIARILRKLRNVLQEERWEKIYLIPFGHSVVSMQIKMAVYRALRIETIDVFYFGEGRYGTLDINTRDLLLKR